MTTVDCLKVGVLAMWGKNGVECFSEFLLKNLLVFRESQSPRSRAYPSIYLSIYLSIYPSIYPSIYLSSWLSFYPLFLQCVSRKRFVSVVYRGIDRYYIVLQPADSNPFRGTAGIYICIYYICFFFSFLFFPLHMKIPSLRDLFIFCWISSTAYVLLN